MSMQVLHLEDSAHDAELVHSQIRRMWPDCEIERVDSATAFEAALERKTPNLILSDFSLPGYDGLTALNHARKRRPDVPFMFLSGTIGEEVAVEALKNGAIDYVLKDRMGRLIPAIQRALAQTEEQTKRRKAEQELRETQERYRQITENVADLIAVLDPQGRRVYNNPAYVTILGEPESLRGTDSFTEIHPDDRERIREIFFQTVRSGVGQRAEYRFLLRDGSVRFIESQGSVILDAEGKVANVLVVSRDVTARKKADDRIREQASLLDKARDAISVVDLTHRITYWNASSEGLFGWTAAEAIGQPLSQLLHAQDPRFGEAMKRLLAEGQWQGELLPQTKGGKAVLVESRWTLVTDAKGKPVSILCINTDITERKKLEVQFLRAQRMESIGTLAGGIAHDLNNVLTPILVAAQVLQMHVSSKEDRMLLETVEKSALHGAALLKQVLLFARGAEGEHTALRIQHLVGELEKLLRETFPRSIEIRTRIGKDTWVIKGDATQLNQVLMNLCVNARDAMPKGGQLEIRAKNLTPGDDFFRAHPDAKPGAYLMLSVQDTGCGIPPEVLERIFDPFFTTKELGKGTGLGLSTVLGIVRSHGGVLQVQSEVGKGTRFDIYLPALPTEETATVPSERPQLPRGQGQGVLVIDDEPYIREVISSMLRFCNYRSFPAAGGQAGIDLYREKLGEIELALVDMMMPGIDGATTMKRLRQINPHLPMIAVSGMLEESQLGDDSELKGVELLRKPITAEVLLNRIAAVLSAGVR